jgi:hypothetical protein
MSAQLPAPRGRRPGAVFLRRSVAGEELDLEARDGRGLDAATPAAIAERAGGGKMSLYRHFAGKDELVAEALAERDLDYERGSSATPWTGQPATGSWPSSTAPRVRPIGLGAASSAART